MDPNDNVRQDRLLTLAVAQSSEGVAVSDMKGNLLFVNRAFAGMHGYTPEEIIGKNLALFHTPEQMPAVEAANRQILESGHFSGEIWHARRDGSVFPAHMENSLVLDEAGNPTAMTGTMHDISEQKEVENQLRRSQREWEAIFQGMGHPTVILDPEHRIIAANDVTLQITRKTLKEILGRKCYEVLHCGATDPPLECPMESLLKEGSTGTVEMEVEGLGGVFLISCTPIVDDDGNLAKIVHVATDITERKRFEEQLKFLSLITEQVSDSIITTNLDYEITYVNRAFQDLYGYSPEEVLGHSPDMLNAEPNAKEIQREIYHNVSSGQVWRGELQNRRKDGSMFPCELMIFPLVDEQGKTFASTGLQRDITERKRVEVALQKSEERYRDVVEDQTDLICRFLPDGTLTFVNEAYCRYFGRRREELLGESFLDFIPAESSQSVLDAIMTETQENHVMAHEHRVLLPGGDICWQHWINRRIQDDQENTIEFQAVGRDITDLKRAEEEKKQLEAQLRQAQKMEAVGQLAGGVAHDFNNLLMVILGQAALLERKAEQGDSESLSETTARAIREIRQAAERGANLTRQLLTFSRRQIAASEVVNPAQLLDDIQGMIQGALTEDIKLVIAKKADTAPILADRMQIEQAILNLVLNSKDAMPKGGTLSIEVADIERNRSEVINGLEAKPGAYAMVAVTDSGHGISEDTLERVFEPFYTTKPVGQGTGLGLAVVYGIVAQAQGYVTANSDPGKGTTFAMYFPATTRQPALQPEDAPQQWVIGNETILLCEDEAIVRRLIKETLTDAGYSVIEAENGKQALEIARVYGSPIHGLLTDLVMPEMNGQDLAEQMARDHPAIRVLFMSGYASGAVNGKYVLDGKETFLQKPFRPEELLQRLRETLDKRNQND